MEKQLQSAYGAGYEVNVCSDIIWTTRPLSCVTKLYQKVILIGGFSASISLRKYLAARLKRISSTLYDGQSLHVRLCEPVRVPDTYAQP
jgi:hypothetical protein